jgi:hypothetical protein
MRLTSALIGLAALGGVALSSGAASAMPFAAQAPGVTVVIPAGYVCNEWGHCWHRHYGYGYAYGYDHPHYRGMGLALPLLASPLVPLASLAQLEHR